jgi:hypothetical protein
LKQYQINLKFKGDALEALQIKTNPFWGQPGAIQKWLKSKYL